MFFDLKTARPLISESFKASFVNFSIGTSKTRYPSNSPDSLGSTLYPALVMFFSSKASSFNISIPLGVKSWRCAFNAAGFIATSTSGLSPGVKISKSAI